MAHFERNLFRDQAERFRLALSLRAAGDAYGKSYADRLALGSARRMSDAEVRRELADCERREASWDAVIRARGNTPIGAPETLAVAA